MRQKVKLTVNQSFNILICSVGTPKIPSPWYFQATNWSCVTSQNQKSPSVIKTFPLLNLTAPEIFPLNKFGSSKFKLMQDCCQHQDQGKAKKVSVFRER